MVLVQQSAIVTEGDVYYVCLNLALPAGGTEREILVAIRTMELITITAG